MSAHEKKKLLLSSTAYITLYYQVHTAGIGDFIQLSLDIYLTNVLVHVNTLIPCREYPEMYIQYYIDEISMDHITLVCVFISVSVWWSVVAVPYLCKLFSRFGGWRTTTSHA